MVPERILKPTVALGIRLILRNLPPIAFYNREVHALDGDL